MYNLKALWLFITNESVLINRYKAECNYLLDD